ncbi:MAG: TorF family putative porin [Comamonadaceae bacterium]
MKLKTTSAFALSALLLGTSAMAQTKAPEPDYTLAYNVGVTTDYRFRGIAQTSFNPALQGGIDFTHKSGLYLGTWASNIKWIKDYVGATDGSLELDLYGGYKGEISKDFSYDVGVITYQYPSNTAANVAGFANANTTEVYGALTYGLVTAKYSYSTGDFIANSNSSGSTYIEVAASFDLGNGFSLTPHVGHQTIPNQSISGDYTDYSLTLGKDFGNGLSASVAAIGTNASDAFYKVGAFDNLGKSTVAVGLKYSF